MWCGSLAPPVPDSVDLVSTFFFFISSNPDAILALQSHYAVRRARKMKMTQVSYDRITTTIEREWLAEIIAGTKKIEYRQIKPYWTKRFEKVSVPFELRLQYLLTKMPFVRTSIDLERNAVRTA